MTTTIATQPVFGGTYIGGGVDTTIITSPVSFGGGCDTIIETQPTYGGTTYIEDFGGGGVDTTIIASPSGYYDSAMSSTSFGYDNNVDTTIITSDYGDCGMGGDYSADYSCDY